MRECVQAMPTETILKTTGYILTLAITQILLALPTSPNQAIKHSVTSASLDKTTFFAFYFFDAL